MRLAAVLLAFSFLACSAEGPAKTTAVEETPAIEQGFVDDTQDYMQRLERLGFSGVLLVASHGRPIIAEGFGLADREADRGWSPETVSTIGSITKQFTGAAILLLEERGDLKTDDPISKYFDDVPADKRSITLHHLLTHSSGIVDLAGVGDWDPIGREEFVRRAMEQPLSFEPGESYAYSNAGYSLLGAIIEQLTGDSYEMFLRDNLLKPAGMSDTGYILADWDNSRLAVGYRGDQRWGTVLERPIDEDGPFWVLRANGGIHSTAPDMLRWADALLKGSVLSDASMAKYWAPHVDEGGGDSHYGYGWVVQKGPADQMVITHNGGNGIHFADMAIIPDREAVVFLQCNVVADWPLANGLLERIGARWFDGQAYPSVPDVIVIDENELGRWVGEHRLEGEPGDGVLRVAEVDGQLSVVADGQVAFGLLHSSRSFDADRAARLTGRIDSIVGAYIDGDLSLLYEAYERSATMQQLQSSWSTRRAGLEGQHGPLRGHRVLGTAMRDRWDVTVVRLLFEQGHADLAYVWDPDEKEHLLGLSGRGLQSELSFVPTGANTFESWDGGLTSSRALSFIDGGDGPAALSLATADGAVTARRRTGGGSN
jgi:CubicO group peptidase (beta-lactamase class C family)